MKSRSSTLTRHDLRKWLGTKSLRSFRTEAEVRRHFTSEGLMPIMGNMYFFEEADEACELAVKMWKETRPTD